MSAQSPRVGQGCEASFAGGFAGISHARLCFVMLGCNGRPWQVIDRAALNRRGPARGDPRFPNLDDYDLVLEQDGEGMWCCSARGRTRAAQAAWRQVGRELTFKVTC
jgi:hypothetical protein